MVIYSYFKSCVIYCPHFEDNLAVRDAMTMFYEKQNPMKNLIVMK